MEVTLLYLENPVFMMIQTAQEDLLVSIKSALVIMITTLLMDIVVLLLLQMPMSNFFHPLVSDSVRIRRSQINVLLDVILSDANFLHVSVLQMDEESLEDFVQKKLLNLSF